MRNIVSPLDGIRSPFGRRLGNAFSPAALFAANEPGGWYDPSDLTTLFQDAAGTTPVTAVEQPVGLVLDKSKGLVLGSELVDTANTLAPWAPQGNNTVELDDGAIKATYVDNGNGVYLPLTAAGGLNTDPVAGRTYRFTAEMKVNVGSSVSASIISAATSPSVAVTSTSFVVVSFVFVADGSNETFRVGSMSSGEIAWVRNISVRELPGSHLSQSTAAARPVLSARVNLLTYTEQFDNAAWTKANGGVGLLGVVTPNAGTDPLGGTTADRLQVTLNGGTASADISRIYQSNATTGALTFSLYVRSYDGTSTYAMSMTDAAGVRAITVTPTWQRVEFSATSSGTVFYGIGVRGAQTPTNSNAADILIWGADLRPANAGVGLPAYQRVGAATSGSSTAAGNADYDTTGFPYYLKFDGTDDGMATAAIDFSGTDKVSVVAGVRKLSDAASAALVELSASSGSTLATFAMLAPKTAAQTGYSFRSQGGSFAQVDATSTNYAAPITTVLTSLGDIANDGNILRANGAQVASSSQDQGSGNYANQPLYIGSRAGSSLRFNGHIYGLVIVGRALTAGEVASMETWVNGKTRAF